MACHALSRRPSEAPAAEQEPPNLHQWFFSHKVLYHKTKKPELFGSKKVKAKTRTLKWRGWATPRQDTCPSSIKPHGHSQGLNCPSHIEQGLRLGSWEIFSASQMRKQANQTKSFTPSQGHSPRVVPLALKGRAWPLQLSSSP